MARVTRIISGVLRSFDESSLPTIYDETLTLVVSAPGAGEIIGPITTGTSVTLPNSGTYDSTELEIYFEGQKLTSVNDYTYVGVVPRTQVQFTFDLLVGDMLEFRKNRNI
jgi:hypothetical protein